MAEEIERPPGRRPNVPYGPWIEYDRKMKERMTKVRSRPNKDSIEMAKQLVDAVNNPGDVILEMFQSTAQQVTRMNRKLKTQKEEPSRNQIEYLRECRQLADRAFEIISARGQASEASVWFASLDTRLQAVAETLEGSARPFEFPASEGDS